MRFTFSRRALACALSLWACAPLVRAQSGSATAPAGELAEITVTGNPLGTADTVAPVSALDGSALLLRAQPTLGETLNGLPGVTSSYFGPNASRPAIRGQDGDRVRILRNGGASADASALSYDHAVPVDALATERIEVLRGAAALQYGGSAVGGVVNVIDNRIPTAPVQGLVGRADLGWASGSREKSGGVLLEGGNANYALHVDAFNRDADDTAVPIELACGNPRRPGLARRICNSANQAHGGAIGASAFFAQGWIGASADSYRSQYGTVAEDDVRIDMKSDRYALAGEWQPGGWVRSVNARLSRTDYRHTEFEGATPGTVFGNRGDDLRLEARHAPLARFEGVWASLPRPSAFPPTARKPSRPTAAPARVPCT